jgi:hypothetical protein
MLQPVQGFFGSNSAKCESLVASLHPVPWTLPDFAFWLDSVPVSATNFLEVQTVWFDTLKFCWIFLICQLFGGTVKSWQFSSTFCCYAEFFLHLCYHFTFTWTVTATVGCKMWMFIFMASLTFLNFSKDTSLVTTFLVERVTPVMTPEPYRRKKHSVSAKFWNYLSLLFCLCHNLSFMR